MDNSKLVLVTASMLGTGYVLVNASIAILLYYQLSQLAISSLEAVFQISGTIIFLVGSILSIMLGGLAILGGMQYHEGVAPKRTTLMGIMLAALYLLCLGFGSALILPQTSLSVVLLIISPILIMAGIIAHIGPSSDSKILGSILGIVGGMLLTAVIFSFQALKLAFDGWAVPFLGPFMSMTTTEGIAVLLIPIGVLIYFVEDKREKPISNAFFSMVILIFGIGMFIGPLSLSVSLWDVLWKQPWLPPLYGVPQWVFNATIFWSISLVILAIGGALLVVSACLVFASEMKELA